MARDGVRLHFNRTDRSEAARRDATGAYDVYVHIMGVDELAEECRRRGASIIDGPEDRVYAQREVVVEDCNGYVLTFGEDIAEGGES